MMGEDTQLHVATDLRRAAEKAANLLNRQYDMIVDELKLRDAALARAEAAEARAEAAEAEVERLRISADATRGKFGATYMHRVAELEAEVERLRARARLIRNQVANEADERWAMAKETENGQAACLLRGWSTMMYDLRRQLDDLLGHLDAPEAAHEADEPQTWRERAQELEAEVARLRLALSRERESAVRNKAEVERLTAEVERLRAQAVPEWAASAPLDEVRAWLDGRGRRSVAHYLDVGWEANLWGDRGTRIARARAETEEAALRALALAVIERGERE